MNQMNQANVICLPNAGYMVKQLSPPLSPMQIRKSTGYLFCNCFNPDMRKLYYEAVCATLHSADFYTKL